MKKNKIFFIIGLLLLSTYLLRGEGVVYVTPGGMGDGSAWDSGMGDIQAAIDLASTDGKQVWIQSGTYSISKTLVLKTGVNVYGGFAGTESKLEERPLIPNGNAWDFLLATTLDGENKCRIMESSSSTVSAETIVDGITFINGNGVSSNGLIADQGGAVLITKHVIYQNCIMRSNKASEYGGGVAMTSGTIRNCLVENNTQINDTYGRGGGAIYANTPPDNISSVIDCVLRGNQSNRGGAIRVGGSAGKFFLTRSKIYNNSSKDLGASIDMATVNAEVSNNLIFNNKCETSKNNTMVITGGRIFNNTIVNNIGIVYFSNATNSYDFANNIVWGNKTLSGGSTVISGSKNNVNLKFNNNATGLNPEQLTEVWGWTHADNILLDEGTTNAPLFKANVLFKGLALNEDQKNELDSIDLHILETSPCVNKGKTLSEVTTDLVGTARPQGNAYDIGSYELNLELQTALESVDDTPLFQYKIQDSGVVILKENAESIVKVYAVSGFLLFSKNIADSEVYIPLNSGIYIIKVGTSIAKIVIP